jgi:prepilin-type N-terminal cleavage/methylation domain-containing protein
MKKFFSNIKNSKGFTLIELLIVVAIIGILSAVVLTSLGSARSKAKEAIAKSQMASMRAQAELFASSNSNLYATPASGSPTVPNMFTTGAASNGLDELIKAVESDLGVTLATGASSNAWAVKTPTSATLDWCVDSTGYAGVKKTTGTSTTCQ